MAIFRGTGGSGDSSNDATVSTVTQKAVEADASATAAAASATAAASSATSAAASYDDFDDRYLGVKASNPSVDNDGNALLTGALYFNSTNNEMQVYNGSSWQNFDPNALKNNTSVTLGGNLSTNGNAIIFGNNDQARFGSGGGQGSLVISATTTESTIAEAGSGDLTVKADTFKVTNANGLEDMLIATPDAGVALYHNDVKKLETTSSGATLTGTLNTSGGVTATGDLGTFGNIIVLGTVDGRDVAADGTKLDGIETNATADQTDAEIKTAYENNSNTNAFTDAEKTKLSGIETGATADQTASEILTAIKTVDGASSGLDADLLDGNEASAFATSAQGSTADSALQNVSEDTTPQLGGNLDLNSNNVTGTGNINITGTLQTSSNAIIGGDLTVSGTTTTVNTETINLADNNILLNSNLDSSTAPSQNGGITINRGSATDKVFQWNETNDYWEVDDDLNVTGTATADALTVKNNGVTSVLLGETSGGDSTIVEIGKGFDATSAIEWHRSNAIDFKIAVDTNENANLSYNYADLGFASLDFTRSSAATKVFRANVDGDISFYADDGTSQDLYWDASTSRLGLGTTSPQSDIHISKSSPVIRMQDTDNNSYGMVLYNTASGGLLLRSDHNQLTGTSGSNIIFQTDGSEAARIDSSGKVGIGTTTPSQALDVTGNINQEVSDPSTTAFKINADLGSVNNSYFQIQTPATDSTSAPFSFNTNNAYQFLVDSARALEIDAVRDISFYDGSGANKDFYWDSSESRLGLGTTSPATTLDVAGTVTADDEIIVDGASGAQVTIRDTGRNGLQLSQNNTGGGFIDLVDAAENLHLRTQSTNNIRIQSSGDISFYDDAGSSEDLYWDASQSRLGIGTTSPSQTLHVDGKVLFESTPGTQTTLELRPNSTLTGYHPNMVLRSQQSGSAIYGLTNGQNLAWGLYDNGVPSDPSGFIRFVPSNANGNYTPKVYIGDSGSTNPELNIGSVEIVGNGSVLEVDGSIASDVSINAQTGTTYTTVLADRSKLVTLDNASAVTVTIPPNSSVAYPTGTKIDLLAKGAGQVTVAAGSGVTVNSAQSLKLRAQWSAASAIKLATDTWVLVGDLQAI